MLRSYKMRASLLALLCTIIGTGARAQTQIHPVNWSTLKNAEVVSGVLQRESGTENRGVATSQQLLFGRGQTNTIAGYFEFTVTSTADLKKIGFVALNDPEEQVGGITYGFSFLANSKVKAIGIDGGTAKLSYNIGDVFRIERVGGRVVNFSINGASVYVEPGDALQSYQIRANLKSEGASFSNVVCSYQTTPFCVVPEIDNDNNTIRLAISGAYPPYTYTWDHGPILMRGNTEDPSNEPIYRVPVEGNYWVTIRDAIGNEFRKRYSVGTDIDWSNLYQTSVSGDILQFTGTSKWGTAVHSSSFNQNSIGWVEYLIDHEDGKRAFGYVDATQTVRKSRHLNAGFLITKDALQVINEGNIVFTGDYENKDVLTLHYFQGMVIWMKNGREFFAAPYTGTGDVSIAGLLKGGAVEKHLYYSFNPDSYITTTWNDPDDSGDILVNIASLNESGPYHYMISKERIPELSEAYTFLTDSIGIPVDSTQFFTGSEAATSFTFNALEAGTYNVAVFNSQGERIFGKEVELYGELSVEAGTGLIVAGNTIQSLQDNATGSLELYLTPGENLGMEVEVNRNNGNIQQFVGLAAESETINSYQDLAYGFYLDGRRLYTVENGVLSSTFEIIRQNKLLEITIAAGELILHANMEDLVTVQLPTQYIYKVGAGLDQGAMLKLKFPGKPPKKSKYRFYPNVVSHLNCDDQLGSFSFGVSDLGNWGNFNSSAITYSIVNSETNQVVVSNGTIGYQQSIPPVTSFANGDPLTAGVYNVDVTISGQVYSHQICLGYEADWDDVLTVNYQQIPNIYSLERDVSYSGSFSFAQARNILQTSNDGWIEFTPRYGSGTSANLLRLSTANMSSLVPSSNEDFIYFLGIFNSILMYSNINQTSELNWIQEGDRVKIVQTGNQLEVFANGVPHVNTSVSPQTRIIRAQSLELLDGFEDVVMSFSCTSEQTAETIDHAELKKKLDGGFTLAVEDQLKFTYDEEYAVSPSYLPFNIYDKQRSIVASSDLLGVTTGISSPLNYQEDDARYIIDLSTVSGMPEGEFYTLEVIDTKGNKKYLKFFYKN